MSRLKLYLVAICCIMLFLASSCTEHSDCLQDIEQSINSDKMNTCSMTFDVSLQDYDSSVVTRNNSSRWNDGDKVYFVLDKNAYGIAEFTSGSWMLNYYGELVVNELGTCVAYYFENQESESSSIVNLSYNTASFKSEDGKYIYDGKTLIVSANLKPMVGRIRFVGTPDSNISVVGITKYTSYSVEQNTFSSSVSPITLTVQPDGYTPYIYGHFTSQEEPRLNVMTGESGFMNIPTLKSHNGWMNNLYFKVDSVGFTMIPVRYNSSVFYLGETEVTNSLYAVVDKSSTPAYPKRPKSVYFSLYYSVKYDTETSCGYFIDKLSERIGVNFRLPTKEEWQYAAQGGALSKGYTYSGSNVVAEVAWYYANSDDKTHDVAQLMPNELGFYDMSGNLNEWTSTKYSSSYYYSHYYLCGGSYNDPSSNCKTTYNDYYSESKYSGIRLALSIN